MIKKIIVLMILILISINNVYADTEMVVNGGFETGDFTGWSNIQANAAVTTDSKYNGIYGEKTIVILGSYQGDKSDTIMYQNVNLSEVSNLSFWIKCHKYSGSGAGGSEIHLYIDGVKKYDSGTGLFGWTYVNINVTDIIGIKKIKFWVSVFTQAGDVDSIYYIDDVKAIKLSEPEPPTPPTNESTLITDKTNYNTSEIITISFTNIDKIYNECTEYICDKPYELHILYPITDDYKQYDTKFIYPLLYTLEDETISLNTSFLSPQVNYVLGIVGKNGYYGLHDDVLIFSEPFQVYQFDEYLSVSCDAESGCYTYNNANIEINYIVKNNSNIIIKDNDNNIINQFHNINGSGQIIYHIPDDIQHINTYPNWKVYMNNTEYSNSFYKTITVYWSQFQTPTPTPTYTPKPTPDINISDTIDEFKIEMQPIKDLIFGLSEIVIDNPDYNKDNIVNESEINHWFNSLIPICIIFLLIILYIGLKKKRE